MPLLKADENGNIYEAGSYHESGMGFGRKPFFADQTNVALLERNKNAEFMRRLHKKNLEKAKALRKIHKEQKQKKKDNAERVGALKQIKAKKNASLLTKALNAKKSSVFLRAARQPTMGYDFSPFIGNPLAGFDDGNMGFRLSLPKVKISLPKIRVPTLKDIGRAVTKVATAPVAIAAHAAKQVGGKKLETAVKAATGVSITQAARGGDATLKQVQTAAGAVSKFPAVAVQKTVQQVGGKGLEKFLDRTTGGTYSQAIKVGMLPGKAVGGEAITKDDVDALKGLAIKAAVATAAVYGAGSIAGAASNLVQQQAAKELGKKIGGSAGSLIASAGSLASGDVAGAGKTFAQEEAKRLAVIEAQKKLGKEAGSILAIGVAGAKGGSAAALEKSKEIAKDKAYGAVAKKTGIPVDLVKAVQSGKVPSPDAVKEAVKSELKAAPDKLQAELKALPAKIAAAPKNARAALIQKQKLIEAELKKRDKVVSKLAKQHAEEIEKANKKIAEKTKKLSLKEEAVKALKSKLAAAPAAQKPELQKQVEEQSKELVKLDADVVTEVASKENTDAIMEAKKVSAANGLFGVRVSVPVEYQHPIYEWNEKAHKAAKG